jgi:hypothetical protein
MRRNERGGCVRRPARQAGGHWFEPSTAHLQEALLARGFLFLRRHRGVGLPALEAEAKKSAELELRLAGMDEHAKELWDELSPFRERAQVLEIELENEIRAHRDTSQKLADLQSGEAERREHREKMNAKLADLASTGVQPTGATLGRGADAS